MYINSFIATDEVKSIANKILKTPFVQEMLDGTLSNAKFKYYLVQDHIYLKYYKDAGMRIKENSNDNDIISLYNDIGGNEPEFHKKLLIEYGIDGKNVNDTMQNYTTYSYINHIIRWSNDEPLNGMYSMFACQWSYEYIAENLKPVSEKYKKWFDFYKSDNYTSITSKYIDIFQKNEISPVQKYIFIFGLNYELNYWEECYKKTL